MALAVMRRGDTLTNSAYRHVTGLDSRVVTRELGDLVNRGLVQRVGSGRWTSYRLVPEQAAPRRRRDRREEILDLLRRHAILSRAEIAQHLDLSDGATRRWLSLLRDEGRIELTTSDPRSPQARYRISPTTGGTIA